MSHVARDLPMSSGKRRGTSAWALVLVTGAAGCAVAAPAAAAVPASQSLVVLLHAHGARSSPDVRAHRIGGIAARRPLTHVRTILPVLGAARSTDGRPWLHVELPGRPNGRRGWILARQVSFTSTPWLIKVELSARRVTVYRDGHVARRFRAIVGKPSTPTPRGRFFVEEALALGRRESGSPYALASSARSSVLQEFDGGPGQIALHGTGHLTGALGSAVSHGCVRLSPRAITWMARRIDGGTPLTITR